jgi:proteasome accessory factor A
VGVGLVASFDEHFDRARERGAAVCPLDHRHDAVGAEPGDEDLGLEPASHGGEGDQRRASHRRRLAQAAAAPRGWPGGEVVGLYGGAVDRRIYGLENEYGVTCTLRGQRRLSPDEVARYLFRRVVSWGRSSNVFLDNGARLYLDVGSHPEYATPECDRIDDLVAHDKAGERILDHLVEGAESRLREEGIRGTVYLFKNNTDSAGNSYGCHENYLTSRRDDFTHYTEVLIPFLVSRQIYAGAGKVLQTARGATYSLSQRAEHIWEGVSSATTRSRPIINTRDEPHADAERFRRLHVIVGDSNMSEYATFLKIGATSILLHMLEDPGTVLRDLTLENPIRAIREISHDLTCRRKVRLANGREVSALDIQSEYLQRAMRFRDTQGLSPQEDRALAMWQHCLEALERDPMELATQVDWVAKLRLIEAYRQRHQLSLGHPNVALIDLQYHDVSRSRSLFYRLQDRGQMERIVDDSAIADATNRPPQTTRARLRGEFIRRAKQRRRDFTVDWVHLKLNDQAQRTVLLKDPFRAHDERVEKLIAGL